MKTGNKMELKFLSLSVNEGFARLCSAGFASQLDPTLEQLSDIKTAISEAVTNAIVHAYRNEINTIIMRGEISDNIVRFEVEDRGCGIKNVDEAVQPFFTTAASEERSGMGFTVMQTFMDKVEVRSNPGRGTTVLLEKKIERVDNSDLALS